MRIRRHNWLNWALRRRGPSTPAAQYDEGLAVLSPLLELIPPMRPPKGLLARIDASIDACERRPSIAQTAVRSALPSLCILVAGLTGVLLGIVATTAVLLYFCSMRL